jgi:voltage-gated potassium channel
MFALPVAIIATGFSQESARHEFVVTWSMVARVPLFSTLDAAEMTEVTKLLYTKMFKAGASIVTAGEPGGAMYLIGSGEATVCVVPGHPIHLHEGDFFGEMALLERRRHKHDVIADTPCRVYVLDSEGLARLSRGHPRSPSTSRRWRGSVCERTRRARGAVRRGPLATGRKWTKRRRNRRAN